MKHRANTRSNPASDERFTPCPPNDFEEFITTYFDRCRKACPKLAVIGGKWTFEDLIPGLSDFDTRFVARDNTTAAEWAAMSLAVGQVHCDLAREYPHWARKLEHLPGINLTRKELTDTVRYYPEFPQWTFYQGEKLMLEELRSHFAAVAWSARDELYHLKKFALYYGPYDRKIDPPVNLGPYASKYPLHSRFMHYFTPPVQSAMSLLERKPIAGKLEALRRARKRIAGLEIIDLVLEAVERHYEMPELYDEPRLTELDAHLHAALCRVFAALSGAVDSIRIDPADAPAALKAKLAAVPVDPVELFFEGAKFARFMKGRLRFFGSEIAWFDTTWLIRIELGRIIANFHDKPLRCYGLAKFGETLLPDKVLERLQGSLVPEDMCAGVREFVRRAAVPIVPGQEKRQALAVAEVFETVQTMLEILSADLCGPAGGNMS